jgi:hypothetical protein
MVNKRFRIEASKRHVHSLVIHLRVSRVLLIKNFQAQPCPNQGHMNRGILERTSNIIPPADHTINRDIQHKMLACGDLADSANDHTYPKPNTRTVMDHSFESSSFLVFRPPKPIKLGRFNSRKTTSWYPSTPHSCLVSQSFTSPSNHHVQTNSVSQRPT